VAIYHFKRFRMSYDLGQPLWAGGLLPGYQLVPWDPALLETHAKVKHRSFEQEVDANVFPCFATPSGCRRLVTEIVNRDNFLPQATLLMVPVGADFPVSSPEEPAREFIRRLQRLGVRLSAACGTIQGLALNGRFGSIQNLGVTPEHRGVGVGAALLRQALIGFRGLGLEHAILEVTADNFAAVRLYQRLGWEIEATQYKSVEILDRELTG
jgi:ribosomal protein S18 acetylase RimI-like enzyme